MSLHAWIGTIGGGLGIASIMLHLVGWWINRKPRLRLFAPYQWSGVDTGLKKRIANIVVRVSNNSRAAAFLYLETMSAELRYAGRWVKARRLEPPASVKRVKTDFPEGLRQRFGLDDITPLRRFESPLITYERPLSGLLILDPDSEEVARGFDAVRLIVKDCHLKQHVLVAYFDEQCRRHDPTFMGRG